MDASSPLQAIRRPALLFGGRGGLGSCLDFSPDRQPRAFNLREQMSRRAFNGDFFRGSSPSSSLAADISQNFNLDQDYSPKFPTPRRALFTSAHMMGGNDSREWMVGPPLLQSSPTPCALVEMMDISPLPHKIPLTVVETARVDSPISMEDVDASPQEQSLSSRSSSPLPSPPPGGMDSSKPSVADRRKVVPRRPSLSRTKCHSATAGMTRPHASSELPPFRFGAGTESTLSAADCFQASPLQERRPQSANSPSVSGPGSIRPRPQFSSLSSSSGLSRAGSPAQMHSRRPSNPFMRPRKQYRRSLSMFESSADMNPKEEASPAPALAAVMDTEEPHELLLPHFFTNDGQADTIPRIKRQTLVDVLNGNFNEHFDNKMVIDCRFEYEYDGGHIDGAVNYTDKDLLVSHLLRTPMEGRTLIIFHCEYSAHRAPLMASNVRAEDRTINAECYPHLTYPEIYILEGGYSAFFSEHRDRCYPQAYVEMDDANHILSCERGMGRLRQHRKGGLHRAQTYAFGQSIQDSPTAPGRSAYNDSPSMMLGASPLTPGRPLYNEDSPSTMLGASPAFGRDRTHARRMASY